MAHPARIGTHGAFGHVANVSSARHVTSGVETSLQLGTRTHAELPVHDLEMIADRVGTQAELDGDVLHGRSPENGRRNLVTPAGQRVGKWLGDCRQIVLVQTLVRSERTR